MTQYRIKQVLITLGRGKSSREVYKYQPQYSRWIDDSWHRFTHDYTQEGCGDAATAHSFLERQNQNYHLTFLGTSTLEDRQNILDNPGADDFSDAKLHLD